MGRSTSSPANSFNRYEVVKKLDSVIPLADDPSLTAMPASRWSVLICLYHAEFLIDQIEVSELGPIWGGLDGKALKCPGLKGRVQIGTFRGRSIQWNWMCKEQMDIVLYQGGQEIHLEDQFRVLLKPNRNRSSDNPDLLAPLNWAQLALQSIVAFFVLALIFYFLLRPFVFLESASNLDLNPKNEQGRYLKIKLKRSPRPQIVNEVKYQQEPQLVKTKSPEHRASLQSRANERPVANNPEKQRAKQSSQLNRPVGRSQARSFEPKTSKVTGAVSLEAMVEQAGVSRGSGITDSGTNTSTDSQASATSSLGLDKKVVLRVVQSKIESLQQCHYQALKKQPQLRGRVEFNWVILPSGKVSELRLTHDESFESPAFIKCLQLVFSRIQFPKNPHGQSTLAAIIIPF